MVLAKREREEPVAAGIPSTLHYATGVPCILPEKKTRKSAPAQGGELLSPLPKAGLGFHVVFMIDTSRSMDRCDVASQQRQVRRIDAVWEAIGSFAGFIGEMPDLTCSLVRFDFGAEVLLRGVPVGGADGLKSRLPQFRTIQPRLGGNYLPALDALRCQALAARGSVSIGVLLTDGRPGDCPRKAVEHMRGIRQDSGSRCLLHTVMFGPEGGPAVTCLKELAEVGGGSFHASVELDAAALQRTFCRLSAAVSTLRGTLLEFGEAALRPLAQRKREAEDLWRAAGYEELHRRGVSRQVSGHIMLPAPGGAELNLELRGELRTAFLHQKPFAEGALRWAYHLWWTVPTREKTKCWHLVVKESKFEGAHDSPQKVHGLFLKTHRRAQAMAKDFNTQMVSVGRGDVTLSFTPAYVIQLRDPQQGSGMRYVTAERYIDGRYIKFNANDGYVNAAAAGEPAGQAAAAFSHFTFAWSHGEELCVDIQGVGVAWTDPQLHSRRREYGVGDLGVEGMKLFFQTHKCNELCDAFHLRAVGMDSFAQGGGGAFASRWPPASEGAGGAEPRDRLCLPLRSGRGRAAGPAVPASEGAGGAEPRDPLCLLCMDAARSVVCRPCGHLCICSGCYKQSPPAVCLVCRREVASVLQLSVNVVKRLATLDLL